MSRIQQGQSKPNDASIQIEKDIALGDFRARLAAGAMYNWVGTTIDAKATLGKYGVAPAINMEAYLMYDRAILDLSYGQTFKSFVFNAYNIELGYMFGKQKTLQLMVGYSQTNGLEKYPEITVNMMNHNNLYNQILVGITKLWNKHISFGAQVADIKAYSTSNLNEYIYANLDFMYKF